jgi:hypothetical protein
MNKPITEEKVTYALDILLSCAKDHEGAGHECEDYRSELVARLMETLGLTLIDIGFIADKWLDISCGEPPTNDAPDTILDAKEIGE